MSELKACPAGHKMELKERNVVRQSEVAYWIACDCGWSGPVAHTEQGAIEAWNRRTEPNEALTVVMPLTETELLKRDGKPVWRYQLDKGIGGWEIFTLDDEGHWYFVCSYLAQGEEMNKAIVRRVKEGRELLFDREVARDMMERYRHKPEGSESE